MKKVAIVVSLFNEEITSKLLDGSVQELKRHGYTDNTIEIYKVPGAVEIPLIAQLLAKSKKYQSIICLGAVIRGDTTHYDYVCQQVSQGCQQVMLEYSLPIIFGVLTTENEQQALDRVQPGNHKGVDAAKAALDMLTIVEKINA